MFIIALLDRVTLATQGYVKLSADHQRATETPTCDRAAHFRSSIAAALIRERFEPAFQDLCAVQECSCPTGLAHAEQLRPPNSVTR